jgi:hypothetical protein
MLNIIEKLLHSEKGNILISAIFGFTLAIMFRPVCKKNCVIYVSPEFEEIFNKDYNFDGVCYRNKIIPTKCINNLKTRNLI